MRFSFEAGGRDFSRVRATFGWPTIADCVGASSTVYFGLTRKRPQHIGSHPHSPGRCGRRPFMFTVLRTCQMSMLTPSLLTVLMMQFWTYFWRFRQCQLNFMPFASTLHAAVAFSRATLSALDIFAASAGVGMNAMPLTSTVAIIPANEAVAK